MAPDQESVFVLSNDVVHSFDGRVTLVTRGLIMNDQTSESRASANSTFRMSNILSLSRPSRIRLGRPAGVLFEPGGPWSK